MRRLHVLAVVGVVTAGLGVALWSSGPAYAFRGFKGDLRALPGCAAQCHVNGGFFIDPRTGRKHFTGGGGGGGGRTVCSTKIARGPVFSMRQRICCDEAGHCTTTNLGAIGN
jgi:hypothetical protein